MKQNVNESINPSTLDFLSILKQLYDFVIPKGNNVFIKMSLTSPGCPVAGELPKQVADELTKIKNIGLIEVELVWDPPWTKERMSEDAKLALDI